MDDKKDKIGSAEGPVVNSTVPPKPDAVDTSSMSAILEGEALKWLRGESSKPTTITSLGDDFSQKLNWFAGASILANLESIPTSLDSMVGLRDLIYNRILTADSEELPTSTLLNVYNTLSKDVLNKIEQARKFVKENNEFLVDNQDFLSRALYDRVRNMSVERQHLLIRLDVVLDKKGTGLLEEFIKQNED